MESSRVMLTYFMESNKSASFPLFWKNRHKIKKRIYGLKRKVKGFGPILRLSDLFNFYLKEQNGFNTLISIDHSWKMENIRLCFIFYPMKGL
jgi:hypothetical protein